MGNKIVEFEGKKYKHIDSGGFCNDCAFYDNCEYALDEILGHDRGTRTDVFGLEGHFEEVK